MASPVLPIIRRTCPQLGRLAARPRASPTPSPLSSARPSPWRRCLHQTRARTEHHPSSPPPPPQQVVVNAAELQFGQPVHETHPHILESGEITIGITAQEYHDRRAALAGQLPVGAVALVAAAPLMYRSGAVFHPYRQDSNMLYLTGFNEADSFAAIQRTGPNPDDFAFHLYVLPKDELAEQWAGPRSGVQAALDVFNADEADAVENAGTRIAELVRSATAVYADLDRPAPGKTTGALYRLLEEEVARGTIDVAQRQAVRALAPIVNLLRAIKSPAEVANMRRAGQLSGRVMTDAMRRAWTHERGLHAFLDSGFVAAGLEGPAYIPVVASGLNANVIHYVHNNNVVQPNDMILVDAGGEYGTYVTDISRTWPAAGRFTPAQRDLYQAVLDVQRAGVSLCRANSGLSLHDIHLRTVRDLTTRLADIGFPVNEANINVLFPHHVGHYVGLDVHDVPGYSRNERLRPGHCVTIEPGVYVPDDERWPKHFRGMGIRIEDSVCVQDEHPLVLTTEAVKEVVDIEALRD